MWPVLMSLKNRYFSYRDSHFRMDKDKENTARMVLYNQLDITNCYTMESSFFGPSSEAYQFTPDDLGYIGRDLALVSLNFTTQSVISKKMIIVKNYLGGIQKVFRASRTHDENLDTIAKAYNYQRLSLQGGPTQPFIKCDEFATDDMSLYMGMSFCMNTLLQCMT